MIKKLLLILALSIPLLGQTNYYLSNAGSGSENGSSWANATAWGDFDTNDPSPGDTVFFDGGADSLVYDASTYVEHTGTLAFMIFSDGEDGSPIVYTRGKDAGHNGVPVFNVPDKYEFYLYGANYVEISYLKIYSGGIGEAERYGIVVSGEVVNSQEGCRYIDILHNEIDYTYGSGLSFTYSNVTIDNNYIHTAAVSISDPDLQGNFDTQNDGIKSNYGFNSTISNNRIINRTSKHDYSTEAHRDLMQLDKMNYDYGSWLKIYNNFMMTDYKEPDSAGTQGIYISTSIGTIDIYNNIMVHYNSHENVINISTSAVEPYATTDMTVNMYNNTIIEDTYADNYNGQTIAFGGGTVYLCPKTINFKNNLVINPRTTGSIIAFYSGTPTTYDFDYNQYEIGLATGFGSSSIGNWATWTGATWDYQDAHSEKGSSLFTLVNEGTETATDYGFTSGSSGIDEAVNLALSYLADDYSGVARSVPWEVGALEYDASVTDPPNAPTVLSASFIDSTSFIANWSSNPNTTGYYLDIATDAGFTSYVAGYEDLDVGLNTAEVVNTGIECETDYYYRVRAYNVHGTSGNSGTTSLTTSDCPIYVPPVSGGEATLNTMLQWTNMGYPINSDPNIYNQFLFTHNDSLYAIPWNSNAYIRRWTGGTTWDTPSNAMFNASIYFNQTLTTADDGKIEYRFHGVFGDYYYNIQTFTARVSFVDHYDNTTIYYNLTNGVKVSGAYKPTLFQAWKNSGYFYSPTADSIISYATSAGYDGDTSFTRNTLPIDHSTTNWTNTTTNLRMWHTGSWAGRRVVSANQIGNSVYVWLAKTNQIGGVLSDTLYLYKANSAGLSFTYAGQIAFADDSYGGIWGNQQVVGDSITYFLATNKDGDNRVYSLHEDGTLTQVTLPTTLKPYGADALSNGTLLVSVNDPSDGNDSARVYIKDPLGEWSWLPGIIVSGDTLIPNKFFELDGDIYGANISYNTPYSAPVSTSRFNGLIAKLSGFLTITSPQENDSYTATDITISWLGDQDSVVAYVSGDNINWTFIDTLVTSPYTWSSADILNTGINGEMYIRLTSTDSSAVATTGLFTYIGLKSITILNPVDSTASISIGDAITIRISAVLTDSISIFYSVGDTLHWQLIEADIKTPDVVNIIERVWNVPSIYGTIYLLATENLSSDTVDVTARIPWVIGSNIPSNPAVCWYNVESGIIEQRNYYDQTCGWGSGTPFMKVTSTLNADGTGYDFIYELCNEGSYSANLTCATTDPLTQGPVWVVNGTDTTETSIEDMYTTDDTLTYKLRRYYVGTADSILYCDDLVNSIDSLVICDLTPYFGDIFIGPISSLTLYDIQINKIQNDTLDINDIDEDLNDADFDVKIMVNGPVRRGTGSLVFDALAQPNSATAVYDIARMFTSLSITRDYFRGIDPKARKKGR